MYFKSKLVLFVLLGIFISTFASNPVNKLENFLLAESQNLLDESVISSKDVFSSRVRWAIDQAYMSQDSGNNDLRDKFLSLAMVYLEGDQFENFMRQQQARLSRSPRSAVNSDSLVNYSETKVRKFSRLYGEDGLIGGLSDKKNQQKIDSAVNKNIEMESWFIAMLEKMGILSKTIRSLTINCARSSLIYRKIS